MRGQKSEDIRARTRGKKVLGMPKREGGTTGLAASARTRESGSAPSTRVQRNTASLKKDYPDTEESKVWQVWPSLSRSRRLADEAPPLLFSVPCLRCRAPRLPRACFYYSYAAVNYSYAAVTPPGAPLLTRTRTLVMQNIVGVVLRAPKVKNLSLCARPRERSPAMAPGP